MGHHTTNPVVIRMAAHIGRRLGHKYIVNRGLPAPKQMLDPAFWSAEEAPAVPLRRAPVVAEESE